MAMLFDDRASVCRTEKMDGLRCSVQRGAEDLERAVLARRCKASFTNGLAYGMLLLCTVLTTTTLSVRLDNHLSIRKLNPSCMEHASIYCTYPVQSVVYQTSITNILSTRTRIYGVHNGNMSNSTARSGIGLSGLRFQAQELRSCGKVGYMVCLLCFKSISQCS